MEAVAKMKDPTTDTYIQGHQYVCAILLCRASVIPFGIRLYVKKTQCAALGVPFRKTTELAAQLIQEFKAPAGVKVLVLFDAYYLCHTVVKACRAQHFHVASTLKSNRRLRKLGWQLKAGRYGRNLFRRRRTETLVSVKPHGQAHDRYVDARGLAGQHPWATACRLLTQRARPGRSSALVTDAPELCGGSPHPGGREALGN